VVVTEAAATEKATVVTPKLLVTLAVVVFLAADHTFLDPERKFRNRERQLCKREAARKLIAKTRIRLSRLKARLFSTTKHRPPHRARVTNPQASERQETSKDTHRAAQTSEGALEVRGLSQARLNGGQHS
jgi:hypothetical protein